MPHEVKIKSYTVCEPCEYHHRVNAFYGKSHSWSDWECKHPDSNKDAYEGRGLTPAQVAVLKEINGLTKREGRWIGRTDKQPAWCPLKSL